MTIDTWVAIGAILIPAVQLWAGWVLKGLKDEIKVLHNRISKRDDRFHQLDEKVDGMTERVVRLEEREKIRSEPK